MDDTLPTSAILRFAARCIAAAEGAYFLAMTAGIPHPIWAPVSALIVMQDSLRDTHQTSVTRLLGTLLGVAAALVIYELGEALGIRLPLQLALAIGITAICAKKWPPIRVCLWTCVLVLLGSAPGQSVPAGAMFRSIGVTIGAIVGIAVHAVDHHLADWLGDRFRGMRAKS